MPYLIGPNSAGMTPNSASRTNSVGTECVAKPAIARPTTKISTSLRERATTALSKRSASWPPSPERMKNGAMKIASASGFSEAAPSPTIWKTMRNPSAFLRKLSLNAEKNWHQNSGAKRRDVMRCIDMARAFPIGSDGLRQPLRENQGPPADRRPEGRLRVASLGAVNFHEQTLGLGILDAVHQAGAFVHVADCLCERDAGLDEHCDNHAQVGPDRDVGLKAHHSGLQPR